MQNIQIFIIVSVEDRYWRV